MNNKNILKIIFLNILTFLILFSGFEILTRLFFPELINETHSPSDEKTGKGLTRGFYNNYPLGRVSSPNKIVNEEVPIFSIIGDSISYGYGTSYQEIYWSRLQRKYNLDKSNKEKLRFLALATSGNNLSDTVKNLKEFEKQNKNNNYKYIMYQFNFNDIVPYSQKQIKELALKKQIIPGFAEFRMKYLFKSTFIRATSFYVKGMLSKTKKKCSERGLNAMGLYTWTFGHPEFRYEAEEMWTIFEKNIYALHQFAKNNNAEFLIFISPTLFDIDKNVIHKSYNKNNLDFSCSTIDPLKRIKNIANQIGVDVINPTSYLRDQFEDLVAENNFKSFYFPGDTNHFTPIAGEHIADYLYFSIFRKN